MTAATVDAEATRREAVVLRIEALRIERGLSPRALARAAGVSEGFCCNIRRGRVELPADSIVLRRLARVIGVPVARAGELLDEMGEATNEGTARCGPGV